MITITVPDNASLEDVMKPFCLEVLRIRQGEEKAAKQIGISRGTLARWLDEWKIILAYVPDGPNVIPARPRKKARAAQGIPPTPPPPSKPAIKHASLQSIMDEAAAIRADHERSRATSGAPRR